MGTGAADARARRRGRPSAATRREPAHPVSPERGAGSEGPSGAGLSTIAAEGAAGDDQQPTLFADQAPAPARVPQAFPRCVVCGQPTAATSWGLPMDAV